MHWQWSTGRLLSNHIMLMGNFDLGGKKLDELLDTTSFLVALSDDVLIGGTLSGNFCVVASNFAFKNWLVTLAS